MPEVKTPEVEWHCCDYPKCNAPMWEGMTPLFYPDDKAGPVWLCPKHYEEEARRVREGGE